jgi:hypothetical protein
MRNLITLSLTAGAVALGALIPLSAASAADMSVAPPYQPPPQAQYAPPPAYGPPPVEEAQEAYVYPPPPPVYYAPPSVVYYAYDAPAYDVAPYYYRRGYWHGYGPRFAYGYGHGHWRR